MKSIIMDALAILAAISALLSLVIRFMPSKFICYIWGHKLVKFLPGLKTKSRIRICDRCYMHHHEKEE